MSKKIKNEVEFDIEAFFKSAREYKEYIRQRYLESISMDKRHEAIPDRKLKL